jgi:hypothetical protein
MFMEAGYKVRRVKWRRGREVYQVTKSPWGIFHWVPPLSVGRDRNNYNKLNFKNTVSFYFTHLFGVLRSTKFKK